MYDHLLSPPSPGVEEEEKDDRLRNDLLDEICNDMGIDDSMDLDLDDFCYSNNSSGPPHLQKPGTARFGQIPQSTKSEMDTRRGSVATSSSGYATSDSLCAMAKLTQSISSEGPSSIPSDAGGGVEANRSPQDMKTDSSEALDTGHTNDTDQGKAAAISNKIMAQRQRLSDSPFPAAPPSETKRKRPDDGAEAEQRCAMNEQMGMQQQQSWPPTGYQPSQTTATTSVQR